MKYSERKISRCILPFIHSISVNETVIINFIEWEKVTGCGLF